MTTHGTSPDKYHVEIQDARGVVVGDDNVVYQYFLDERYRPLTEHLISFDVLIGERTQDFVGRAFLDDALSRFMRNNDRGYFALVAEPGIGKTSWAAHVVQKYKALHHFNIAPLGIVRPETALQNLCAQIIARFKLDRPYLPTTAGRDGSLLDGLLQQASERLGENESLVIVIDALDEVRMPPDQRNCNVLYLPGALPKGVYVVATQRPDPVQLSTEPGSPLKTFTLNADLDANMFDVRAFLRAQVHERGLVNPLKSERFVDALATASQGNFMYLAYALQDLAGQPIESLDLSQLPQGLYGYYDRFWGEMAEAKGEGRTAWTTFYKPVIGVLAVVREPVSAAWMSWVLDLDEEEVTDFALARWRKFLQRSQVGADVLWRPYHRSFSDFLREKLHGGQRAHRQLADRYLRAWGDLEAYLPGLQEVTKWTLDGGYGLRHLATHLVLARKMEQLRQLLMTFTWLQAKLEATSVQDLLQDYVHLPDDPEVKVVHEAIKRSAQVLRRDPAQLASQLLGRLQTRPESEIQTLLRQAADWRAAPWLRPLTPSLIPPGDPLLLP